MTFNTSGLTKKRNRSGVVYYKDICGEVIAKKCTKCGTIKKLYQFSKSKKSFGGVQPKCKECNAKYFQTNREKIIRSRVEYLVEYRRANQERIAEYNAKYYQDNREKIARYYLEYGRNNRKRLAEYRRNNRERAFEYHAEYRRNNRKKISEYQVEYGRNNPHISRLSGSKRRARLRNLPDDLTHEQKAEILAHFDGACALSGDTGDGHLDHVIPISIGHGGTIRENMIPLRADLNISKHARNIFDWFADTRERFGLEQRRFDELITYLADINGMTTQEYEEYVRWCHDNPRDLTKEDDDATA